MKNTAKNYKSRCERIAILYAEGKTYAETKYHDTVDINDINFDTMPTCIYIHAGYGKALRCGRQLL